MSRLYYESTGVVFVKYKGTARDSKYTGYTDADYKVVTGKAASGYDKTVYNLSLIHI